MKRFRLYIIMVLLAIAGNTLADELYVETFSIAPGETKTISVELNNPEVTYTLLEFSLSLPEGISIAKDENGDWLVQENDTRFTNSHQLEVELQNDGSYKFLIYSNLNTVLNGNSGEIFSITLTVSDSAEKGTYLGRFYDQFFVDPDEQEYDPEDVSFEIRIGSALPGDVNGDETVTIADVTALVNILLGKDKVEPYQYDHDAANVNGDENITKEDITALMNIILGNNN